MFSLFSLVSTPISRRRWVDWEKCTWMMLTNFQIRGARVFKSSAKFPYLEGYSHHLLVSSPVWVLKKKNDPISLIFFLDPPCKPLHFFAYPWIWLLLYTYSGLFSVP